MSRDDVLDALAKLIDQGGELAEDEFTAQDLAKRKGVSRQQAQRLLARLEEQGKVEHRSVLYRGRRTSAWRMKEAK